MKYFTTQRNKAFRNDFDDMKQLPRPPGVSGVLSNMTTRVQRQKNAMREI